MLPQTLTVPLRIVFSVGRNNYFHPEPIPPFSSSFLSLLISSRDNYLPARLYSGMQKAAKTFIYFKNEA